MEEAPADIPEASRAAIQASKDGGRRALEQQHIQALRERQEGLQGECKRRGREEGAYNTEQRQTEGRYPEQDRRRQNKMQERI